MLTASTTFTRHVFKDARCSTCGKSFRREDHLKRHELTHRTPQHHCSYAGCGRHFHRRDALKRHNLRHSRASASSPSVQTPQGQHFDFVAGLSETVTHEDSVFDFIDDDSILQSTSSPNQLLAHSFHYIDTPTVDVEVSTDLGPCVKLYMQYEAPRLPCVHIRQLDGNLALKYAVASLGALHSPEYRSLAVRWHETSTGLLGENSASISDLVRFQTRTLGIEFGLWSRKSNLQQSALHQVATLAKELREQRDHRNEGRFALDWEEWLEGEAYRRTAFCLYINVVLAREFLGCSVTINAQDLDTWLPCDDLLWHAGTSEDWVLALSGSAGGVTVGPSFAGALHGLLRRDSIGDHGLEACNNFRQYILLSALLDAILTSKSMPTNYTTPEGWQRGDMTTFMPKRELNESLKMCKILWSGNIATSWQSQSSISAHPDSENAMLLQHMFTALHCGSESINSHQHGCAIDAAIELFTSCAGVGFAKVAETCRMTISRPGRYCALASAILLRKWVHEVHTSDEELLSDDDRARLWSIRQACRRGIREGIISDMDNLTITTSLLWSTMLGSDWIDRREDMRILAPG